MTDALPGPTVLRLASELAGRGADDPSTIELAAWLAGSPRFRAFAEAHRGKLRKKLRGATDPEARRDVRAELQVARLLLADRRVDLAMEPAGSRKGGPDFGVTFRGATAYNLEVTRRRQVPDTSALGGLLVAKLRQLPPSAANAILFAIDAPSADLVDVPAAIRMLRHRADAKDDPFFAYRGIAGSKAFYEQFLRLGGVFVWCDAPSAAPRATQWTNPSARIALPDRAVRASLAALRADG